MCVIAFSEVALQAVIVEYQQTRCGDNSKEFLLEMLELSLQYNYCAVGRVFIIIIRATLQQNTW